VLDLFESFAGGQLDRRSGDVVLQVDELLRRPFGRFVVRHLVDRLCWLFQTAQGFWQRAFHRSETGFAGRANAAFKTVRQGITVAVDAVDATDTHAFLRCFTRNKTEDFFTPGRLAAQVRGQVNHRAVAAGTGHQVAVQEQRTWTLSGCPLPLSQVRRKRRPQGCCGIATSTEQLPLSW